LRDLSRGLDRRIDGRVRENLKNGWQDEGQVMSEPVTDPDDRGDVRRVGLYSTIEYVDLAEGRLRLAARLGLD
jgi:hypothetical protein